MTEWAAGLFEGEGCCYLQRVNRDRQSYATLRLSMVDKDIMRRFADWANCGQLYLRDSPSKKASGRQPIWCWSVTALEDVVRLVSAMFPLLGERRRQKIVDCLAADTRLG